MLYNLDSLKLQSATCNSLPNNENSDLPRPHLLLVSIQGCINTWPHKSLSVQVSSRNAKLTSAGGEWAGQVC
jgi:hypothetical protein